MSFAWYSSGSDDDDRPAQWDEESERLFRKKIEEQEGMSKSGGPTPPKPTPTLDIPIEFTNDYYINGKDRRNSFIKGTYQYREWEAYRRYAMALCDFYYNCRQKFYETFSQKDMNFPKLKNPQDLKKLADAVAESETFLTQTFHRGDRRTIKAKVENHAPIKRLHMYGAKAWIMYHMLENDNQKNNYMPIRAQIEFKQILTSLDENNPIDLLYILRKTTIYTKRLNVIGKNFLKVYHGGYHKTDYNKENLYSRIDSLQVYDEIATSLGANTQQEYLNLKNKALANLERIGVDKNQISLINYYKMLEEVYDVSLEVNGITNQLKNGAFLGINPYIIHLTNKTIDGFKYMNDFLQSCIRLKTNLESLPDSNNYQIFIKDLNSSINNASRTIEYSKESYKKHTYLG